MSRCPPCSRASAAFPRPMATSKRKLADLLDGDQEDPQPSKRPCATSRPDISPQLTGYKLTYPPPFPASPPKPISFQKPSPLITFSYTPSRTLEFNDLALRYFVDPPHGAQLGYGYERWVQRPEERGRVDGLLKALDRVRQGRVGRSMDVGVVSWRGVMTK